MRGGLSLLDASFSSYPGASWDVPTRQVAWGLTPTPALDAACKELPRAPKANLTLSATYTKDLPGGVLTFTANGYASERSYLDVGDYFAQPGYAMLGLRATFAPASQPNLVFAVWGNNITNVPVILGTYITRNAPLVSYQPPANLRRHGQLQVLIVASPSAEARRARRQTGNGGITTCPLYMTRRADVRVARPYRWG